MKPTGILIMVVAACFAWTATGADKAHVAVMDKPDTNMPRNEWYGANREPLLASPLASLPFGAVKPHGWLRKQLELEADGYPGHLTEISNWCRKDGNAWLDPDGLGHSWWEEVPYWLRGYTALGYVLDDTNITAEAKPWIETMIAGQADFGYFGPNANLFAPMHPAVPADLFTTPDGKPGLRGEYFTDREFKTAKATRVDPKIDFAWPKEKPPIDGMNGEQYSVRWTGRLTVKETGDYIFSLYSDDGARMWLDGEMIVDNWGDHGPFTATAKKPVHLEAGKPREIKVDYYQGINGAEIRLGWKKPGCVYTPGLIIPDLMPNMNMLYALRSYYEYTGDKRVVDLMTKYFKWELEIPDAMFYSGGWQVARNGDNIDSVLWLYNKTGDKFLLELAAKLERCGARWLNLQTGGHNVQFSQGFRKPAIAYQQNKDTNYLNAAEGNWNSMMGIYGQVPGGLFGGDEFARPGHTDPRQAIEACGCVEMMISEELLLRITGEAKWADRCENAAFNTLPATTTADMKALRYLTSPNQVNSDARSKEHGLANGGPQQVMNPFDHRCCLHNTGSGWPYFARSLWHATPGNGLCATFYAASTVKAKVGSGVMVQIEEETQYPFDGAVQFAINPDKPVQFPFYLRIPGWCKGAKVTLNGTALDATAKPGAYLMIDRTWQKGDKLALELPMEVSLTTWAANKNCVSVNRGPLAFSVKIGEKFVRYEPERIKEPWAAWEIMPTSPWNYGLEFNPAKLVDSFKVVTRPLPPNTSPFTHDTTPVMIQATARKIPNWKEDSRGLVDSLQPSPVLSTEPVETITLIPMGAARLRLSAFPVIGTGTTANQWQLPVPVPAAR